ncbi:MAG: hypothetical protein ACKVT2_19005 [Saprospiraceae bacterium]
MEQIVLGDCRIDLTGQPAGVYFLTFHQGDKRTTIRITLAN